ncbi:MAG: histidine phosphatase family protein [Nocardioides sp.]
MMSRRVLLARHGLADYESDRVTDDGGSLTPEGRTQAKVLGAGLVGSGVGAVWSSPLSRAVQTAEIAGGVLDLGVTVREGLREYAVGSIAGTDADEAAVIGPVFRAWTVGDDEATIPGGERVGDLVQRMRLVLDEVVDAHANSLVVSHGGVIMATVPLLVGLPREAADDLVLDGGGFLELERTGRYWSLSSR